MPIMSSVSQCSFGVVCFVGDIYPIYGDSGLDEFNFKGAVLKQIRQKVPWVAGGSILGFTGSDEDLWLFPGFASVGGGQTTTKKTPS